MKLLYTINSPYARKVRIVAIEKGLSLDMQQVVLADPDCPVKQYNPLAKVPVLILHDGSSLYDSRVIVEYLDDCSASNKLIPQVALAKISVRRWEALADGVCDAAVAIMLEQRKAEAAQDAAWVIKQMDKVSRGLTVLNDDLADRNWCVDDAFSLADIAVGCMLAYVTMRFAKQIDLAAQYPNLHRLHLCLQARPSFAGSEPSPY